MEENILWFRNGYFWPHVCLHSHSVFFFPILYFYLFICILPVMGSSWLWFRTNAWKLGNSAHRLEMFALSVIGSFFTHLVSGAVQLSKATSEIDWFGAHDVFFNICMRVFMCRWCIFCNICVCFHVQFSFSRYDLFLLAAANLLTLKLKCHASGSK